MSSSVDTVAPSPVRTAVLGLGYWGPNLARNVAASPNTALVGLCDQDPARLRRVARQYPTATASTDLEGVLVARPDLVMVATPVASHFALAERCLKAGCHVLLEKPFTATVAEGEALLALADRLQRRIFVDHTFLFTGAVEAIKSRVEAGELGELLYIDSVRINLGLFQPDVDVIWDLAPHDVSILQYVLGRLPAQVSVMGTSHNPRGTLDVAYLHLDYGGGLTAHLHLSWLSPVKIRRMIFAGAAQSLIFDDLDQESKIKLYDQGVAFDVADVESQRQILVSYRKGEMRAPVVSLREALAVQVAELADAIRSDQPARCPGEQGVGVVRVLEAASRSFREGGRPVELS